MNITKITIGRLYNLGNYEHVRYELTAEIPEGKSATIAVLGMEKILAGMKPVRTLCVDSEHEIKRMHAEVLKMEGLDADHWQRDYGHCVGTREEVIERYKTSYNKAVEKREAALALASRARALFDDLGGASEWKDAKVDWDDADF
jgi:hypothetical protein